MKTITIIQYLLGSIIFIYFCGVFSVWICEFKISMLCRKMIKKIDLLKSLHLSRAVFYAKKYKITEDCRRNMMAIEKLQQFILKNILMLERSSLKMHPNIN